MALGRLKSIKLYLRRPDFTRSGVNGISRNLTPVASKIALPIAAAVGIEAVSPTPSGSVLGWSINIVWISGISGNLRIGYDRQSESVTRLWSYFISSIKLRLI